MEREHKKLRHELKYYINKFQYVTLSERLSHMLKNDAFSKENNEYHVRSLYLDDVYNSALFEKQSGTERRKKYRIRIYNMDDKVIKLEKKSKIGQLTNKQTSIVCKDNVNRIITGDTNFLQKSDDGLMKEIYVQIKNYLLKPVVIVDYYREAYTYNPGNIRITFDKSLRTGLDSTDIFNGSIPTVSVLSEPIMIMEIKYDSFLPAHIRCLLQIPMTQRMSISKYAICRKFNKTNNWEDN